MPPPAPPGSVTAMSDQPPARTEIDDLLESATVVVHDDEAAARPGVEPTGEMELVEVDEGVTPPPARRRKSAMASVVEWLVVVAVAVSAALLVKAYVLQQFQVSGDSMRLTLHDGDRVLVNKLSYRLHDPHRGDVVVLKTIRGENTERDLIKRVIGLPGETVEVRGNCAVYIDGRLLQEPYLDPVEANCSGTNEPGEWLVPADTVFVMGDNRDGSMDSRAIGPVPYGDLLGRAFVVIWPTDDWQWL